MQDKGGHIMTRRTAILIATITLLVAAAVPLAYAAGPGRHRGMGEGFPMMRLERAKEALDLNDDQVDQIKAIFADLRQQNAPYREQLRGNMRNVAQTLIDNPNNISGAQAVLDQQLAAERTMKQNALNAAAKALGVLTPEQRGKLAQFIATHEDRRR